MKKILTLLLSLAILLSIPASLPAPTDVHGMVTYCYDSQDLSADSLTLTCTSLRNSRLAFITIHADGATTETIEITLDYKLGDNYDTLLKSTAWSANTDFLWEPEGNIVLRVNDIIKVTVTDGNGLNTVYATIALEEITWTR